MLSQVTASSAPGATSTEVLPVEQYVATLNRKRMAAGVLFRDALGQVLLVEPSYKKNWEIPGGAVEADESPWRTAERELREEIGWAGRLGRLLVVDYVRPQDGRPEGVVFVFDGGVLTETDVSRMVLNPIEIISAGFYSLAEVAKLVKPLLADRLSAALEATREDVTVLCEQGRRIA
ncbi:NUDIX domain-containing protein [Nocardia amamiensis]|uniref:NUDIX domain-containing protein n=1 Tax=Nocardia amamiensis TaxID=404578 RepID=UPI0008342532|nr:NUDIX hydrolase [Nocardia amamiensis]